MKDMDRIADRLLAWESLDSAERPEDPAALYPADPEEAAELRRRADLLRRFDAAFCDSMRTIIGGSDRADQGAPIIPGCVIRGVLGRGGMGVVYRAWQEDLEREVAIKMLPAETATSGARSRRFVQEARVLARLRHGNIVPVYEAALHRGQPYFVMELMTGGSLAGARDRFAEPRAAAGLVEQVARAVQHAHDQEILHRDLKPLNILLDDRGHPRVSDFGLAKLFSAAAEESVVRGGDAMQLDPPSTPLARGLTATDGVVGTPVYMSPEQFTQPAKVGPAADIWALGVILYELLAGQRPFSEKSPGGLMRAILDVDPPRLRSLRPQLPRSLEAIVLKCLAKAPADRYPSAAELAEDLGRWLAGQAPRAYPDSLPRKMVLAVRRHSTVATIVGLFLVGIAAALTYAVAAYRADPERVRESTADSLAAGRPAVLLAERGPPLGRTAMLGATDVLCSSEKDRTYFVGTHSVALVELWKSPPPIYRFEVEVRHEDNPGEGMIGIFVDHFPPGNASPQATCYAARFTDRGANAWRSSLPGGRVGTRVEFSLQCFEATAQETLDDHVHRIDNQIAHVPPTPSQAPGPWRRLRIDVGTRAVMLQWLPGGDAPDQQVRLDDAVFRRQARILKVAIPELSAYEGRPASRGALGLYVSRSAASFRNAVLQALSVDP
jgi:hypothetical protein